MADQPPYYFPVSELSVQPSGQIPIGYSPLLQSCNFNQFLAWPGIAPFQGNHHPPSNDAAISTASFGQLQGVMAAPEFQTSTGDPSLLAANSPTWASSGTGLMFRGHHQIPLNLYQDPNNTRSSIVPQANFHCTRGPRMPPNIALPIPPRRSGAQPKKRYPCDIPGCNVSMARRSDLPRHKLQHSDSRRKCPLCEKEDFTRSDKVKAHLKDYHKVGQTVLRDNPALWKGTS